MKERIEIKKIERTDKDIDNTAYEIKIPYTHTDDYGNSQIFYKKETVNKNNIETELLNAKNLVDELETKLNLMK